MTLTPAMGRGMAIKLGELLVSDGLVTEEQLQEALELQKREGSRLGETLVSMGILKEGDLALLLAERFGAPFVDLDQCKVEGEALKLIPAETAGRYVALPLSIDGRVLKVAVADPTNVFAVDDLKFITGRNVELVVAKATQVEAAIESHYGSIKVSEEDLDLEKSSDALPPLPADLRLTADDMADIGGLGEIDLDSLADAEPGADGDEAEEHEIDLGALAASESISPVAKLVYVLIVEALKQRASDIHITPRHKEYRVSFRVDGVLRAAMALPVNVQPAVVSRIKSMFNADLAQKKGPQAGRVHLTVRLENKKREVSLGVMTMPVLWGEAVHLKVMGLDEIKPVTELGLRASVLPALEQALSATRGIVVVTGPRRSGLATTFYSALSSLQSANRHVVTLETGVEAVVPGITQVPLFPDEEATPAEAVGWVASGDADVIGVNRVLDGAMLDASVAAALDSLIVAVVRGTTAAKTLASLRDTREAKVLPLTLAGALRVVVAQRLVRRVCVECRSDDHATPEALIEVGFDPELATGLQLTRGKGCPRCGNTGYYGRVALFEVLPVTEDVRDLLVNGASYRMLEKRAVETGMVTLRERGLEMIKAGLTTVEEVLRETEPSPL